MLYINMDRIEKENGNYLFDKERKSKLKLESDRVCMENKT